MIHNNATVYLATNTATLGEIIYLLNEDDSSVCLTSDGAFKDYETGDEAGSTINLDGMENVTGGGQQGGEEATIDDSMCTVFNPQPGK